MRFHFLAAKLAGLTLCIALSGCLTAGDFPNAEKDRAALEEIRARILDAELRGDATVFGQVATADVVVMPPNAATVHGRDASMELMRQFFSKYDLKIEYASAQIQVNRDQAFDRGTYSQTMTPKGGGASVAGKGKYWWYYTRNADGIWQQSRVVWTSD
jgi:ketosteroid isomerase-like protein